MRLGVTWRLFELGPKNKPWDIAERLAFELGGFPAPVAGNHLQSPDKLEIFQFKTS